MPLQRPARAPAGTQSHADPVERYLVEIGPLLRRIVGSVCGGSLGIDPAEIEQDVRVRLWRILSAEKIVAPSASYVYRTAATAVIDAVRRVRARREDSLEVNGHASTDALPAHAGDDIAARTELKELLQRAIERLAADRRRAVRLHLQGLTTHEIAQALDWTEPKARNIVYRGLAELRGALKDLGVESAAD